ncbi:hypothetical protein EVAR_22320_1 [Eumeta japonica]|uniref:Uncharacterized protein n=1 Tax=Eumeta variegata TaxID=151549 RepID=A0A4C1UBE9_EUMVA|nr:hypothetical protein EVAR_22320_1 [Eumeta japonica]
MVIFGQSAAAGVARFADLYSKRGRSQIKHRFNKSCLRRSYLRRTRVLRSSSAMTNDALTVCGGLGAGRQQAPAPLVRRPDRLCVRTPPAPTP